MAALSALALAAAVAAHAYEPDATAFEASVKPFLTKSCVLCHNSKMKTGGLDLEAFPTAASIAQDSHAWEKVLGKLRSHEMPPVGLPRPDEAEVTAVTDWIEAELARADDERPPDPGRVTARRLNRTEYNNTVRDLLGVDLRPADDFPRTTPATASTTSATCSRCRRSHGAIRERGRAGVARGALRRSGREAHARPADGAHRKVEPSPTPLFDYDRTGLSLPNSVMRPSALRWRPVRLPGAPRRRAPPRVGAPAGGALDRRQADRGPGRRSRGRRPSFDDRQDLSAKRAEFTVRVTAGEHHVAASIPHLYEGLPASYKGPNPSPRPEPPAPRVRAAEGRSEKIEDAKKKFEAREAEVKPPN